MKSNVLNIKVYMKKSCLRWGKKRRRTERYPVCIERNDNALLSVSEPLLIGESKLFSTNSRPSEPNINSDLNCHSHVLETGNKANLLKKKEYRRAAIIRWKKKRLCRPSEPNVSSDPNCQSRVLVKKKTSEPSINSDLTCHSHVLKMSNEVNLLKKKPSEASINSDPNCHSYVLETGNEANLLKKKEYRRAAILRWKKKRLSKPSEPNINSDPNFLSQVLETSKEVNLLKKKEDREASISRWKKKRLGKPSEPNINGDPNKPSEPNINSDPNCLSHVLETTKEVNLLKKKEDMEASTSRLKKKRLSRPSEPNINGDPNCDSHLLETCNEVNLLKKKDDREASISRWKKKRQYSSVSDQQNINGDPNCDSHVLETSDEVNLLKKKENRRASILRCKKKRLARPSEANTNADPNCDSDVVETSDEINVQKKKEYRRASIARWKKKRLSKLSEPNINGDRNCDSHVLEKRKEVNRLKKKEYRIASILRWKKKRLSRASEANINSDPNCFSICHPTLSNLKLKSIKLSVKVVNVVAPHLKNFTVRNCIEEHLISVADLASLLFRGSYPLRLHTDGFHFLVKANISVFSRDTNAHQIVCLLQQLHSLKFLTVNSGIFKNLSSSMELISYQPCPFANLKRLKIYPNSLSLLEHHNEKVTMSTKVKNYLLESPPSTIFPMVSNEDITALKNATSAQNLIRKLQVTLMKWKDSDTNTSRMDQGNAQLQTENLWHIGGMMTQIERYWGDLNEQMEQGKRKTTLVISMLKEIEGLLTNVPPSQRANLQERFSSLCAEADITMKIIIEHISR